MEKVLLKLDFKGISSEFESLKDDKFIKKDITNKKDFQSFFNKSKKIKLEKQEIQMYITKFK